LKRKRKIATDFDGHHQILLTWQNHGFGFDHFKNKEVFTPALPPRNCHVQNGQTQSCDHKEGLGEVGHNGC
jgi:hypothetical protein